GYPALLSQRRQNPPFASSSWGALIAEWLLPAGSNCVRTTRRASAAEQWQRRVEDQAAEVVEDVYGVARTRRTGRGRPEGKRWHRTRGSRRPRFPGCGPKRLSADTRRWTQMRRRSSIICVHLRHLRVVLSVSFFVSFVTLWLVPDLVSTR